MDRPLTPEQFLRLHLDRQLETKRQETLDHCIRVIQGGGSLYGWPPLMVDHCRGIIAERAQMQRRAA